MATYSFGCFTKVDTIYSDNCVCVVIDVPYKFLQTIETAYATLQTTIRACSALILAAF